MGIFSRRKAPQPMEQKSVSLPELLFTFGRGFPRWQKWDTETAIEEGLKASAIFYSCCRIRADAIAQVPWVVKREQGGEKVEVQGTELHSLISNPNPDMAWAELMEQMSYHLDLAGNSYWSILRAGNQSLPRTVWPMLPQGVKVFPGRERLVEKYQYQYGGVLREILSEDMIHVKTSNPNDFVFGMPTIQAAGRAVDIDREASAWQYNSLYNRGVSDYAIIIDPATPPDQIERIKQLHKDRNAGPDNARSPLLSTRDIKPMNQNAVEMDFVKSRTKVWEEICSAMGVPLPMIGILENATLANVETSRRIFWLDSIVPMLRRIRSQLNQQLAREFGLYLDYDLSGIEALREDYSEKLSAAEKLFRMGVPFNRIDEVLELEVGEIDGGEAGYLPSGLIPSDLEPLELSAGDADGIKRMAYGK